MGKWAGKNCIRLLGIKTEDGETPVVQMKTELESVTKQEAVHNTVVKAGPKSHLLYVTVIGGHRYPV